jgi:hypothetical protein
MSVIEKPVGKAVQEVVDYAVTFTSLGYATPGKVRIRSSVADLLHTMGYYAQQMKTSKLTNADRLTLIAEALRHISDNLES